MSQGSTERDAAKTTVKRLWKLFLPLAGVTAALSIMAVLYVSYDLVKGKVSPCESIFRETAVGLSTKISSTWAST
jgi:hypothetical protein